MEIGKAHDLAPSKNKDCRHRAVLVISLARMPWNCPDSDDALQHRAPGPGMLGVVRRSSATDTSNSNKTSNGKGAKSGWEGLTSFCRGVDVDMLMFCSIEAEKTSSAEFHESLPTLLHSIYKGFSR